MRFEERLKFYTDSIFAERYLVFGKLKFLPIWADSMGAKSYSFFIETPDLKILIDPGCAAMQPSYPMPDDEKRRYRQKVAELLKYFSMKADIIVVTHYHYDHHLRAGEAPEVYIGKLNLFKNPNFYINESQHKRAREFFKTIALELGIQECEIFKDAEVREFSDPVEGLRSKNVDFGDYNERRKELFEKGKKWLFKLFNIWRQERWIGEFKCCATEFKFVDGRSFQFGGTRLRFTPPLFHGIEYDRTGWVVGLIVEVEGAKLLYTSDLQGPQIEDYADWIVEENPDILIIDGPPTYLFGYMMNRINLERAIKNMKMILREISPSLIVYDHHLLRDRRYKERVVEVYQFASEVRKELRTFSELHGMDSLIDALRKN